MVQLWITVNLLCVPIAFFAPWRLALRNMFFCLVVQGKKKAPEGALM